MEKSSDEFKRLCDYVKNTHAATHNQYDLVVEEVKYGEQYGNYI